MINPSNIKHELGGNSSEIAFMWEVLLSNPEFKVEYEKQLMIRELSKKDEPVKPRNSLDLIRSRLANLK